MLHEIIKQQQIDVNAQSQKQPLASFQSKLVASDRDFYAALNNSCLRFILECKHRSPSEGLLCKDYPYVTLAKQYEPFADVISVLTNERYFGGSMSHLQRIRDAIKLPVLCKDIVVSPYQVALARSYGADAILLMLSVLDDTTYLACLEMAESLNMGILTEVINEAEMARAIQLKAKVIAVNHRDLNSFALDHDRVINLAAHFPKDTIIIAASGINTRQDITRLSPYVNGFLIGSVLSKSKDLSFTLRELVYGPIKICGLTTARDSRYAYEQGASYGGLIFVPSSPRCLDLSQAEEIVQSAPLRYVAVFAQQSVQDIVYIAKTLSLFAVQLHGSESLNYLQVLRAALPPSCQLWFAIKGGIPLPSSLLPAVDYYVIDNINECKLVGTGEAFDWQYVRHYGLRQQCLLAGGINPHNVSTANQMNLHGLDINSGVEIAPGIKDHTLILQLFQTLKEPTRCQ